MLASDVRGGAKVARMSGAIYGDVFPFGPETVS
jgi:hypothetical protein